MNPDIAAKFVSALDAEIFLRHRKRYEALVTQWRQESDDSAAYVLAKPRVAEGQRSAA